MLLTDAGGDTMAAEIAVFPQDVMEKALEIAKILRLRDRFLVCAHASPDGDAVGATLAMGWILRALGKEYILYNDSCMPAFFSFMPLPAHWHTSLSALPFKPQNILFMDCGDVARAGEAITPLLSEVPSVNIDHHLGNPNFGTLTNWVDPSMAASAQMVAYIAKAAGLGLRDELARALALGILMDTGGFRHANTDVRILALATHLVQEGLNLAALRAETENQWSLARMRLWGRLMGRVTLHRQGAIASVSVRLADLRECGALKEDLEGFVEQMRALKGSRVAVLAREDAPERIKFSLRSSGKADVRAVAASMGGGGHRNAAGCSLNMDIEMSEEHILQAVNTMLDALE